MQSPFLLANYRFGRNQQKKVSNDPTWKKSNSNVNGTFPVVFIRRLLKDSMEARRFVEMISTQEFFEKYLVNDSLVNENCLRDQPTQTHSLWNIDRIRFDHSRKFCKL